MHTWKKMTSSFQTARFLRYLEINFDNVDINNSISTKDIFARIPKVEDLRLQVYGHKTTTSQNLKEQLMTEILPHCKLKALKILLSDENQVRELGQCIGNSSNQLEQMEIRFPRSDDKQHSNIHDMRYLLESLTKLQKLRMLNLDLNGVQFSEQEMENTLIDKTIYSVKNMKIWIQDFTLLKLLDKCFTDIQRLAISCHPIQCTITCLGSYILDFPLF